MLVRDHNPVLILRTPSATRAFHLLSVVYSRLLIVEILIPMLKNCYTPGLPYPFEHRVVSVTGTSS